ncbi:fimbrial protein [Xenorhabdus szentirmaii]|uniref:Major MR/P fimbria protein n=1 Tax=Xenorhabdus szentirmaii DSM 16338 TaxID=1427518 RepID=W1IUB6_9GAMM|nr:MULTISPECIES: fimbrial protein [Xenorhabdus]MBD2804760.1 type 1 fimbrial protein [Xenorhabdus sp. ZM]MBD2821227.1 type 1 fimbrial protein [Xenorhabdus sp. 42]PHM33866.1 major fimbrial subunit polypeptide, mrfA [Xenorhabdus szentirmaii DSM 16338]PHM42607.1 major fimbrial subunit polypeptide, mrfA [Xenorhabdus szentirmaii]CDL81398.1 Major MR/P fimbria protein [Xenorhabdus szentirmaii DSM 16338]
MKLNKLAMVLGLGVALTAGMANAETHQGKGKVEFTGSIINSVCSIKDNDLKVNLGEIASHTLRNGGSSHATNFNIELRDCEMGTLKGVTATFTGAEAQGSKKGLLAIQGQDASGAEGAGIMITNHDNKHIPLDQKSNVMRLYDGSNNLNFSAKLVGLQQDGENKDAAIKTGAFMATANFVLNYE